MSDGAPKMTDAKFLKQLLDEREVFKSGKKPVTAEKIKKLASRLGALRLLIEQRKESLQEEEERQRKIRDALDVLIELLPEERNRCSRTLWSILDATDTAEGDNERLKRLDRLNGDAVAARVGMQFGPHPALLFPFESKWHTLAPRLAKMFNEILGKQPKDATYRFIVAVIPYLTGEQPNADAVEQAFKRNSFAKRPRFVSTLPEARHFRKTICQ